MLYHQSCDPAELVCSKAAIGHECHRLQPELGHGPLPLHMDVRRFPVACAPQLGAAQNRCWVCLKHGIDCDNGQLVFEGLTHQHTVKRVPVDSRQGRELTDTGFIQGETRNLVAYALCRQIVLWRVGPREACRAYWAPRALWGTRPVAGRRRLSALSKASVTHGVSTQALMAPPCVYTILPGPTHTTHLPRSPERC
jgi:hypothetical protein